MHNFSTDSILSNWNVGRKLALMLFFPVASILFVSGRIMRDEWIHYRETSRLEEMTHLAVRAGALVHELQKERGRTSGFLGSAGESFQKDLQEQRKLTDTKLADYAGEARQALSKGSADKMEDQIAKLDRDLSRLGEIRSRVDRLSIRAEEAIAYYSGINHDLISLVSFLSNHSTDRKVTTLLYSYINLIQNKERAGIERAVLSNAFAAGSISQGLQERLNSLVVEQKVYLDSFLEMAPPEEIRFYRDTVKGEAVEDVSRMEGIALRQQKDFGIDSDHWFSMMTEKINLLHTVEGSLTGKLFETMNDIKVSTLYSLYFSISLIVLTLFFSVSAALYVGRNITSRLISGLPLIHSISGGDLTLRLDDSGSDEIARFTRGFNGLVENLNSLIGEITRSGRALFSSSEKLNETSQSLASGMEETTIQSGAIETAATEMNMNLHSVASSVEEMSITVGEVARRASEGSSHAKQANDVAMQTQTVVQELGKKAAEIGSVIESISSVANQTNLLALNAAIEAAGAGDAGRGFAVVANEVKELARQASESAGSVKEKILSIQASVEQSVAAMMSILDANRRVADSSSNIAASVEEQSIAAREISSNVAQTSGASEEVTKNIAGISSTAKEGSRRAAMTAELAKELHTLATTLTSLVGRFRTK